MESCKADGQSEMPRTSSDSNKHILEAIGCLQMPSRGPGISPLRWHKKGMVLSCFSQETLDCGIFWVGARFTTALRRSIEEQNRKKAGDAAGPQWATAEIGKCNEHGVLEFLGEQFAHCTHTRAHTHT